jgi:hypothetical protein
MNRCFQGELDSFHQVSHDLIVTSPYIAVTCLVAFVFSYVQLILIRYAIKYIIWIINIGFIVVTVIGGVCLIMLGDLVTGGALLFSSVVCVAMLFWFRERIRLVAKLFKETSKTLIEIPSLMFEPILVR